MAKPRIGWRIVVLSLRRRDVVFKFVDVLKVSTHTRPFGVLDDTKCHYSIDRPLQMSHRMPLAHAIQINHVQLQ
jgi:hypothetical protein